jgi:hypothetical protein
LEEETLRPLAPTPILHEPVNDSWRTAHLAA